MSTPGTDRVGSLADEAGQLIDAVTARLTHFKSDAALAGGGAPAESVHTCVGWCPICRGADLLRGDRSEISEKLVDTALLVLGTLRSLIPEQPSAAAADGSPTTEPDDRSGVERIDIR